MGDPVAHHSDIGLVAVLLEEHPLQRLGAQAFVLETHLKGHDFFAGPAYSIADMALYAYTHVAHEGGFDLAPYPGIRTWLARVAAQPGHIHITD